MTSPYILLIKEPRGPAFIYSQSKSIENIKDKMKDSTMTCLWRRVNVAFLLFYFIFIVEHVKDKLIKSFKVAN